MVFSDLCAGLCSPCQVLYKHEGQNTLKVLDKSKSTVKLLLPKDNSYVVLEIRSWGEGGDGPAHEIIVSRDSGEDPHQFSTASTVGQMLVFELCETVFGG